MTRRRKQNIKLALVCAILGAIVLMTIFAPWLAPYDPLEVNMELRLLDPCRAHPLGTDDVGRDLLARLLCGGRVSLLIGLCSNGVHSNGFSLVRKVLLDNPKALDIYVSELGRTIGEELLRPTHIYVKSIQCLRQHGVTVKAISHITGGGFYENIPRSLKAGCCAVIKKSDVRTPVLFDVLAKEGNIPERDMFNTFNMGVGMVLTVPAEQADKALDILHANGEPEAYRLGIIAEGEGVELC